MPPLALWLTSECKGACRDMHRDAQAVHADMHGETQAVHAETCMVRHVLTHIAQPAPDVCRSGMDTQCRGPA